MVSCTLILLVFASCNGFLLDNNGQQPTRASLMTDSHYNILMTLLNDERQSRIQLEKYVKQLQQDFLDVKRVVTTEVLNSLNTTFDRQIGDLKSDNKALKDSNRILELKYNSLKYELEQMQQNNTIAEGKVLLLEQEVSSLKQLKVVADLASALSLQNKTDHLEHALQVTNAKLGAVNNDVSARKQDFIALYNKVEGIEKTLDNKTSRLGQELQSFSNEEDKLASSINETTTKLQELSMKFHQHQSQIANKVILTSCTASGTVQNGNIIQFNSVKTINGVQNEKSIQNSGTFICENAGIYQISVYVSTRTKYGGFSVMKNGVIIAEVLSSLSSYYQTATSIVLTHLSVNDTISVVARYNDMYIYSDIESCLSILQVV